MLPFGFNLNLSVLSYLDGFTLICGPEFKRVKLLGWIYSDMWAKAFKIVENMCAMLVNLVKQASIVEGVC